MCLTQAETGFRTSAGISCSKMLAKLVSGMHKPDDQTVILPCHAAAFVATLPVRAIPGEALSGAGFSVHHSSAPLSEIQPHASVACAHLKVIIYSCFALYLCMTSASSYAALQALGGEWTRS